MSEDSTERRPLVRTQATRGGCALHVVDTGSGIPRAQLGCIYDPLFTRKAPGQGTGLGLTLVHGIVSDHLGEIRVDSEIGRGAAFRIDLRRALRRRAVMARAVFSPAPRLLRVRAVDDEDAVR